MVDGAGTKPFQSLVDLRTNPVNKDDADVQCPKESKILQKFGECGIDQPFSPEIDDEGLSPMGVKVGGKAPKPVQRRRLRRI